MESTKSVFARPHATGAKREVLVLPHAEGYVRCDALRDNQHKSQPFAPDVFGLGQINLNRFRAPFAAGARALTRGRAQSRDTSAFESATTCKLEVG